MTERVLTDRQAEIAKLAETISDNDMRVAAFSAAYAESLFIPFSDNEEWQRLMVAALDVLGYTIVAKDSVPASEPVDDVEFNWEAAL